MDIINKKIDRRNFVKSSMLISGIGATTLMSCTSESRTRNAFKSEWQNISDRDWIGAEYWSNPMQDWEINDGKLHCKSKGPSRNIHHLTHTIGKQDGNFEVSVTLGCTSSPLNQNDGSAGFMIAALGPLQEYRNNIIYGEGIEAGVSKKGFIFIDNIQQPLALPDQEIILVLTASSTGSMSTLTLIAVTTSGQKLAEVTAKNIKTEQLHGNIALKTNFTSLHGNPDEMNIHNWPAPKENSILFDSFWFSDWSISGTKIDVNLDRAFGPIFFNQFTVSRQVLKMTVQMPPMGLDDSRTVRLQTRSMSDERVWVDRVTAEFDDNAFCGTFRVENWDDKVDAKYRIEYVAKAGSTQHHYHGTIPRDPADKENISVANISCNHHDAFPNFHLVQNVKNLRPDLLAIVGDQYYENSGGFGNARHLNMDGSIRMNDLRDVVLDSLRKWMMHGWTWRHLLKDIPSICLPDDHDVYQGNIWGEGGLLTTNVSYEKDRANMLDDSVAGYKMMLPWIIAVHKQQTSHNPDAYAPEPTGDGVPNYYGDYLFGRINFAILADRQHKSGPAAVMPRGYPYRLDHIIDMDFDLTTIDDPSLNLLGDKQEEFLEKWVEDWQDTDIKAIISQTIFTAMATTSGPERIEIRADLDTNAWPQNKRDKAVAIMRKAFPVHIAGDQHLPAVVQYGLEDFRDGPYAFAGPAVNVGYPRWFEPRLEGTNRAEGAPRNTGDFKDGFNHNLTVYAVGKSPREPRKTVMEFMQDKMSGVGFVTFNKSSQKITFECWPFQADPRDKSKQMEGWPVIVDVLDNYSPKIKYYLPTITVEGLAHPVFKVINEENGETIYTIRRQKNEFQPFVPTMNIYTIEISDGAKALRKIEGLISSETNEEILTITV